MLWLAWTWWVLGAALVLPTTLARRHGSFPDVIIGDPNEPDTDILGPPLSNKDLERSLRSLLEPLEEGEDPKDPTTSPSSKFIEGDIMVSSKHELNQLLQGDPQGLMNANRNQKMQWPKGVVPYVISAQYTSYERGIIAQAIADFSINTCIRFVGKDESHYNYIHIQKGVGCSSYVGRQGGQQIVSIGNGCMVKGIVIHELMHAIGFPHEQAREDRDQFVKIHYGNILDGSHHNFHKSKSAMTTELGLDYDYGSVMHYSSTAFNRDYNLITIETKQPGVNIGQRKGMSKLDIKGVNLLYQCSDKGRTRITKPKPGSTCIDERDDCSALVSSGYCTLIDYKTFMNANCRKSCGRCGNGECKNRKYLCGFWKWLGHCATKRPYMTQNCAKSCKLC